MSCQRASEIDLAAFAAEPSAPEWQSFRSHYPTCADCAGEVATWSKLGVLLEDGAPEEAAMEASAHPAPDLLMAFGTAPGDLDAATRSGIDTHVEACAPCRSELAVLRDFDMAAVGAPAAEPVGARPPLAAEERKGLLTGLSEFLESLFGLAMPEPLLAGFLIAALALPSAWLIFRGDADPALEEVQIVQEEKAPPIPHPFEEPTPVEVAIDDPAPDFVPAPEVAPEPTGQPQPQIEQIAEAPTPPAPEPTSDVVEPAPEPILIAALLPAASPQYLPDASLAGGSLGSIRGTTLIRASTQGLPHIAALGPPHVGASNNLQPTLYWHLADDSPVPVEIVLVDASAVEPLLELQLDAPVTAGLHRIDLTGRGVRLEPGRTYEWSVSLIADPEQRDLDILSNAAIRIAPADAAATDALEAGGPGNRAHAEAAAGYWYDAFDTLSGWIESEPDAAALRAHRNSLLEQAELEPIE